MAETSRRDPSASRTTGETRLLVATEAKTAALLVLLTLACLVVATPSAFAWSNGGDYGNGFGTHDWVLYEANQLAEGEGYFWLRTGAALRATDDPDTRLHDTYHHVYDIWGTTYGDAPDRVQALFDRAVRQIRDDRPRAAEPHLRPARALLRRHLQPDPHRQQRPRGAHARAPRVGDQHAHERQGRERLLGEPRRRPGAQRRAGPGKSAPRPGHTSTTARS